MDETAREREKEQKWYPGNKQKKRKRCMKRSREKKRQKRWPVNEKKEKKKISQTPSQTPPSPHTIYNLLRRRRH